jgi:branched-chain amino acid transport system substrate-binding protein
MRRADPKEKVKIVSSMPRTGGGKDESDPIVNGIRLAIAAFEKGLPLEVEYIDMDDSNARTGSWSDAAEADIARKCVAAKDVVAVIGPYHSGAARVSAPILNEAGLVQITPAATYPGLTRKGPFSDPDEPDRYRPGKKITFCRVCPHDGSQGPLSADFAASELKAKSVYVLDDKQLYGRGLALGFKKRCEELKLTVAGHESANPATADYAKLIRAAKGKSPDLVYFGGTTKTGAPRIAIAMIAEKLTCPLLLPEGCYEPAFVKEVGPDALDAMKCFVTVPGINPESLKGPGADFVKLYKDTYGKVATAHAVYGYEAAAVLLEAIRKAGKKDREAIRAAAVGTKDFDKGLLGKWSFDANGDTTLQPLTVTTIEKGKFKAVKVLR